MVEKCGWGDEMIFKFHLKDKVFGVYVSKFPNTQFNWTIIWKCITTGSKKKSDWFTSGPMFVKFFHENSPRNSHKFIVDTNQICTRMSFFIHFIPQAYVLGGVILWNRKWRHPEKTIKSFWKSVRIYRTRRECRFFL